MPDIFKFVGSERISVSELCAIPCDKLRCFETPIIIEVKQEPVAVLVPYEQFIAVQGAVYMALESLERASRRIVERIDGQSKTQ